MKNIYFNPVSKIAELTVPSPKPSKEYVPDWYKKIPQFYGGKPEFKNEITKTNQTLKMCMPFADTFTSGYIQETWQEIAFTLDTENLDEFGSPLFNYYTPADPQIMGIRGSGRDTYPIPEEYYPFELTWHPAWTPELPEGYSVLITHPLNRTDLPFYTLSGIVDSDTFTHSNTISNLPFLLKRDFTGIIKKGTPMYQMIPIKREDWKSIQKTFDADEQIRQVYKLRQYFWGAYKRVHWNKKNYS